MKLADIAIALVAIVVCWSIYTSSKENSIVTQPQSQGAIYIPTAVQDEPIISPVQQATPIQIEQSEVIEVEVTEHEPEPPKPWKTAQEVQRAIIQVKPEDAKAGDLFFMNDTAYYILNDNICVMFGDPTGKTRMTVPDLKKANSIHRIKINNDTGNLYTIDEMMFITIDGGWSLTLADPRATTLIETPHVEKMKDILIVRMEEKKTTDLNSINKSGNSLAPVREIAESVGADVIWNPDTETATITKGNDVIVVQPGNEVYFYNGEPRQLPEKPYERSGTLYVPVRDIAESLGGIVEWNQEKQAVTVTTVQPEYYENDSFHNGESASINSGENEENNNLRWTNKQAGARFDAPIVEENAPTPTITPTRIPVEEVKREIQGQGIEDNGDIFIPTKTPAPTATKTPTPTPTKIPIAEVKQEIQNPPVRNDDISVPTRPPVPTPEPTRPPIADVKREIQTGNSNNKRVVS